MAWTAPKTWAASEVILASGTGSLNEQIRDNLTVLSTHAHTGAAGMGASTLSTVTLGGLNTVTFADQSGNPSTNGRLQRNGANLLYYDGTSAIDLTASDQAAGTASLRTLGTGATQAAAGNHTHAVSFTTNGGQTKGVASSSTSFLSGGTTFTLGSVTGWTPSGDGISKAIFLSHLARFYAGGGGNAAANPVTITIKRTDVGNAATLKTITGATSTTLEGVFYQTSGTSAMNFAVDVWFDNDIGVAIYATGKLLIAETTGSV